jgi:integrase
MASLYKKPIKVKDPKTGKMVKARSRKWWGRYVCDGREKRVPLAGDKTAAEAMLRELVVKAEKRKAGIADPFELHRQRPLAEHLKDFKKSLEHKAVCQKHIKGVVKRAESIIEGCKWKLMGDMSGGPVQRYLADRRKAKDDPLSVQTSNHYLRGIKQFSRWLVRDRRTNDDPLAYLAMLNVRTDRKWERRALSGDEFARLVAAAEAGKRVESISGPDRAMMYLLAGWTGFRKTEIGSLTRQSFELDADQPTVTVAAGYSKRRREDKQFLHPVVAVLMQRWLDSKKSLGPKSLLFPVSGAVPGGTDRKTAKMMRRDLEAARKNWIAEAKTDAEKQRREKTDFLTYCDSAGLHADFHSNRHTFITNLSRTGIAPKMVQQLARHSDIRLTMDVYTHVGVSDQVAAINALPAPVTEPAIKQSKATTRLSAG